MPPHPSPSYPAETGDPNAPLAAPLAANEAPVSAPPESLAPPRWRTNLILFIATVFSVLPHSRVIVL